jgi:hypothetical protein
LGITSQGRRHKAPQLKNPLTKTSTKQQGWRSVSGRQKDRQEIQGRSTREVMGKVLTVAFAVGVASLFSFAVFVIQL